MIYHIILYHIILYHIILYYIIPYYIILYCEATRQEGLAALGAACVLLGVVSAALMRPSVSALHCCIACTLMYIYIYIYIYMYVYVCVYIYICICICIYLLGPGNSLGVSIAFPSFTFPFRRCVSVTFPSTFPSRIRRRFHCISVGQLPARQIVP